MRVVQRSLATLLACTALLTVAPRPAQAEWHLTPLIGLTFRSDTTIIYATSRVHWNLGGATTLIGAGPFGIEGLLLYTPGFFEGETVVDSHSLALMVNVVVAVPRRWSEYGLRPFVSGGLGQMRAAVTDISNILPVRKNLLGFNIGGGAVGFITEHTGLRFDLRRFGGRASEDLDVAVGPVRVNYWTATVGVVFRP